MKQKRFLYLSVILVVMVSMVLSFATIAQAQTTLRITTIPEEAATEQIRKFGPLSNYLERTLGMKVAFIRFQGEGAGRIEA